MTERPRTDIYLRSGQRVCVSETQTDIFAAMATSRRKYRWRPWKRIRPGVEFETLDGGSIDLDSRAIEGVSPREPRHYIAVDTPSDVLTPGVFHCPNCNYPLSLRQRSRRMGYATDTKDT